MQLYTGGDKPLPYEYQLVGEPLAGSRTGGDKPLPYIAVYKTRVPMREKTEIKGESYVQCKKERRTDRRV